MVTIKAFKGIRPQKGLETKIASRPYDVLNSEEARTEAKDNNMSLYHIIKPEIDFPVGTDEHSQQVYDKALENFNKFKENNWLIQDKEEKYYIYSQKMEGRTQIGLVACSSIDDYLNGNIKKHELTRKDKEEDRMVHVKINNANIEPIFLAYPANPRIDQILEKTISKFEPEYNFTSEDGITHSFWLITSKDSINEITKIFTNIPYTYVADGHHRSAAAALVGKELREKQPSYTGKEEFNYFLTVLFPDNQLKIFDYNRLIKDLNGLTPDMFLVKLSQNFIIENKGKETYRPENKHIMGLYLDNNWYKLSFKENTYNDKDPIDALDVTTLTKFVLEPLLNIHDLRTSKRIDFVGGIRGLQELEKRVDSGEMKAAFAMYPVSMEQLMAIADNNMIMPPKTTWFEPKLRSGLIIHSLED
ncbi:MAG: DUF1015 family protein [Candidatus Margulisbacteria bacterium]|nr:DUF1015 family protein [Candidatus Margulisiibacteriota bacterium]